MFRRIERLTAEGMPEGYTVVADPNEVARIVLGKSTWAVLGLTCHVELFTQQHYKQSILPAAGLSELYRDVFLYHWKEESQHAILDELEWRHENTRVSDAERDAAVEDLIALVCAVEGVLRAQSEADTEYFLACNGRKFTPAEAKAIRQLMLKAYHWQYIVSGVKGSRFLEILGELTTETQMARISSALAPLM